MTFSVPRPPDFDLGLPRDCFNMATTDVPSAVPTDPQAQGPSVSEPQPTPSRRQRAFLGQLPDDFLRVDAPTTAQAYPQQGTAGQQAGYRDPRLVPMTYGPQAAYRPIDNGLGRLRVTVSQAKLNKNYGFTRMDPYCRIRIGHSVYETPTDTNGSKSPRWNKVFTCNLPRGVNSMYIEIFNERYLALDDRVAWAYFEFPEDLFNGETVEEWVALNGKLGEGQEGNVNIILSFTPAPPQTAYQLTAYGNQPVSMVPAAMPGAQLYYHGGYPPTYPQYVPQPQPVMQPVPMQPAPQPQQPLRPRIREEDVTQLREMFPSLDEEVVRSVLEASNGQVDSAVTNLLQMTQ